MANAKKKKPEFRPEELPFLEECCCEPEINAIFKLNVPEAAWGRILGNIQNQEDLIALLKEKQDVLTEENAGEGISITVDEEGIVKINNTRVSAVWGKIEGDISNQEDLMELLESIKNDLTDKIDTVEGTLNDKIDTVEGTLNDKIDTVEGTLNDKIDTVEGTLNDKIDAVNDRIDEVEETLTEEINKKQDILTEENAGDGISITNEDGTVKINNTRVSAVWGNIEGNITDQTDLVEYIDENGGKIDVIKRNDVVLPIEDKTVNIEVPEDATDISYSNPDYPTVAAALDKLLYVMPSVSISGGGNYEIGYTKENTNLTWTWNKTIKTQSLNQGIGSLDPAVRSYTYSTPITSNTTFTITGSDGTNSKSASTSVNFMPKRYWGVSTSTSLTDEQILALSSELSTSRTQTRTFDCSGGKYFYFVIRTQYCSGIKFKVGGLSFSDMIVTTRDVVNAQGYSASYNIYRVNNIQTGSAIVVEVS